MSIKADEEFEKVVRCQVITSQPAADCLTLRAQSQSAINSRALLFHLSCFLGPLGDLGPVSFSLALVGRGGFRLVCVISCYGNHQVSVV